MLKSELQRYLNRTVRVRLVSGKTENGMLFERENDLFYTVPTKMSKYRIHMSICFTPDEVDMVTEVTVVE